MRPQPIAAATAAALLCAALTSCTPREEDAAPDPPTIAAADPQTTEADEASPPPRADAAEQASAAVGWAAQPLERDGQRYPGVVGGARGETVTAADGRELAAYLAAEEPLTVRVSGRINLGGQVEVGSDKTLEGTEGGAELTGGRLVVDGSSNVVLSNLEMDTRSTAVAVRGGAHHVWVDGSTFSGGGAAPLVSVTDGADHVTLSWNRFTDAEAAVTIGGEEEEPGALRVTLHHNYFDGTEAHHPLARFAEHVHVFNNYFRATPEHGVESAHGANVLVEGNYFENAGLSVSTTAEEPGNAATRDNLLVDTEQPDLRGTVPDPPYAYDTDDTTRVPDLVAARAGVS
ncbi:MULTISPECIES: polysaccharide lyase family 1 protein [unclassified Nocardiopsis]|uniref:pectate lyase family protein n=1 Tax=unclassified Nocardiopsis TaxID=2649073 RepID=UPI0013585927|nr:MULTISPECIES: right-handed parallel beta-helix repeat-containing protein [unclassified Nocardiopsis]